MATDPRLARSIHTLGLTDRALVLLDHAGFRTVGDVLQAGRAGLMAVRGFGRSSLASARDALRSIGLGLPGDDPQEG